MHSGRRFTDTRRWRPKVPDRRRTALALGVWSVWAGLAVGAALVAGCAGDSPSAHGDQDNWLRRCAGDAECGGLSCLCGACTAPCDADLTCGGRTPGQCVATETSLARVLCGGGAALASEPGVCMPDCTSEGDCDAGQVCLDGVCALSQQAGALLGNLDAPAPTGSTGAAGSGGGQNDGSGGSGGGQDDGSGGADDGGPVQVMGGSAAGLPESFGRNPETGCWELGAPGVLVSDVASGDSGAREALRYMHTLVGDLLVTEGDTALIEAASCLRHISGDLVITGASNEAAPSRFLVNLPQLRKLSGTLRVEGTRATRVSASRLAQVVGDLIILDNPGMDLLPVYGLDFLGGRLQAEGNPSLPTCMIELLATTLGVDCECRANRDVGPCP